MQKRYPLAYAKRYGNINGAGNPWKK